MAGGSDFTTSLAVGLGVGIPIFVVIVGYIGFLIYRKRRLSNEDSSGKDVEAGLADDMLYTLFSEQLNSRFKVKGVDIEENDLKEIDIEGNDLNDVDSEGNELKDTKEYELKDIEGAEEKTLKLSQPLTLLSEDQKSNLSKVSNMSYSPKKNMKGSGSGSGYDFYDTFIPILPRSDEFVQPPGIHADGQSISAKSTSARSSSYNSANSRNGLAHSLIALAALLHNPQFSQALLLPFYTNVAPASPLDSGNPSFIDFSRDLRPPLSNKASLHSVGTRTSTSQDH